MEPYYEHNTFRDKKIRLNIIINEAMFSSSNFLHGKNKQILIKKDYSCPEPYEILKHLGIIVAPSNPSV